MEIPTEKVKWFHYFVLYRLMDIESIMWDVADFLIKPVAFLKGRWLRRIHRKYVEK